ncbi:MAG: hypothetical protein DRJ65_07765 [Acidobacteria bacterium]|nr:MAG: hypothetical protein DRJ65_07765 [Acidobacteriota bacterium]
MESAVPRGSRVVLLRTGADGLKVGDLAVFESRQGRVMHRVVFRARIGDLGLVFHRGDIAGGGIGVVQEGSVAGKVISFMTDSGWAEDSGKIPGGPPSLMLISKIRCMIYCQLMRANRSVGKGRIDGKGSFPRQIRKWVLGASVESDWRQKPPDTA